MFRSKRKKGRITSVIAGGYVPPTVTLKGDGSTSYNCPHCGKRIEILNAGNNRCSHCKRAFVAEKSEV